MFRDAGERMGKEIKNLRCGTCDRLEFDWDEVCFCEKLVYLYARNNPDACPIVDCIQVFGKEPTFYRVKIKGYIQETNTGLKFEVDKIWESDPPPADSKRLSYDFNSSHKDKPYT